MTSPTRAVRSRVPTWCRGPRSAASATSCSPPTGASAARTTRRCSAPPRGEIEEHRELARDSSVYVVGRKAESYFRFREVSGGGVVHRLQRPADVRGRPSIAAAVREPFLEGRIDRVQVIYTRFITVGRQEVVVRPLMPLDREIVRDEDERARESEGPAGGVRVRARARRDPGPAPAALRRGAHLRRAAQRGRVRARRPPAGDEGGDRQRRRADHEPHRVMNRARQDAITTEIMEIVGGAEALRHAGQAGAPRSRSARIAEAARWAQRERRDQRQESSR